jgi:ubiquinone/menaquinone biosynthesis C-methylase UbiE
MNNTLDVRTTTANSSSLALDALKTRMQATWASGDFAVIGTTLQIVGEELSEAADLRTGQRVLDVACGNGNALLAAARRGCDAVGLDFVPELLQRAAERAFAERAEVELVLGDAEMMPFDDGTFDAVLSTFGVMFAPNHEQAAREMVRVCASGGKIALASWTPEGFIGKLLRVVGKRVPPPAGVRSPALWGSEAHLAAIFGDSVSRTLIEKKMFAFRYASAAHFIDVFRTYYGPTYKAFRALDEAGQAALHADIEELLHAHNIGGARSLVVPAEYLEVILQKA